MNMKKYGIGMYGGKFMPLHKGHWYCLDTAAKECDKVYFILFLNGNDEENILKEMGDREELSFEYRRKVMESISSLYDNVIPVVIDTKDCRLPDNTEDWDAETPLVRGVLGDRLDAVYSSEPKYGEYFHRAYPEAFHRLVDPPRITYPVSGTMIREDWGMDDIKKFLIEDAEDVKGENL